MQFFEPQNWKLLNYKVALALSKIIYWPWKLKNITVLHFMTTFQIVAQIEIGWTEKVAKPILGTSNISDVCMHVQFINSQI